MVIQKCEKSKKWIFSKNSLTLFWPKCFFGPKQCKTGNTIKIGVSTEIAKKNKNDTFFWKRVFLTWLKKWVLLTVFLKSCVFLKTLFLLCFQQNTVFQKQELYVEKNRKFIKNCGLFLNMAKWCFFGVCFLRF